MKTTKTLIISIDGSPKSEVPRDKYVKAKTKQMREFGYPSLTEQECDNQITALLAGKEFGKGLTVIGMFMEGEVLEAKEA